MDGWVVDWLSADRLQRYLSAAGYDSERALRLYEWNANLNAALLHDFAHFEVGVRNLYDRGLMRALQPAEAHWLEPAPLLRLYPAPAHGNDPNLRSRRDVEKARRRLGRSHVAPGAIMADLTFGFWAMMTSQRLEVSLWPYLQQVLPPQTDRRQLHDSMMQLNKTRNRVAHHEPTRPADAEVTLRRMRRIATYISLEFADHLEAMSTVRTLLRARP